MTDQSVEMRSRWSSPSAGAMTQAPRAPEGEMDCGPSGPDRAILALQRYEGQSGEADEPRNKRNTRKEKNKTSSVFFRVFRLFRGSLCFSPFWPPGRISHGE